MYDVVMTLSKVNCRVFEDKQSCIAVAKSKKPPTQMKHITIKYYYFCSLVDKGVI